MYLFWKRNSLGTLSVSQSGIAEFADSLLLKQYSCRHVSLSASEDALFLVIGAPKESNTLEMEMLETRLKETVGRLGFSVRVSWVEGDRNTFSDRHGIPAIVKKPLVWGVWAAGCSVLISDGLRTLLWSLFWGCIFYFGAGVVQSERGIRLLKKLRRKAGR